MLFAYRVFKLQKETLNNVVTKVGEERGPQPKKSKKEFWLHDLQCTTYFDQKQTLPNRRKSIQKNCHTTIFVNLCLLNI